MWKNQIEFYTNLKPTSNDSVYTVSFPTDQLTDSAVNECFFDPKQPLDVNANASDTSDATDVTDVTMTAAHVSLLRFLTNPSVQKIGLARNGGAHLTLAAWYHYSVIKDKKMIPKVVEQNKKIVTSNSTYLRNTLIAYAAILCRGNHPQVNCYVFDKVDAHVITSPYLLERTLAALDKLHGSNPIKLRAVSGPDVRSFADNVLRQTKPVDHLHR